MSRTLLGVACLVVLGCGNAQSSPPTDEAVTPTASNAVLEDEECRSDGDCGTGQLCLGSEAASSGRRLQMVYDPCQYRSGCASDSACGEVSVCQPANPDGSGLTGDPYGCGFATCETPCGADRVCDFNQVCAADGHCVEGRCDDPAYRGCPDGMVCDATYLMDDVAVPVGRYTPHATAVGVNGEYAAAARAGCVFRLCDDPEGFACNADYVCDPDPEGPTTGCMGIPCEELGRCSSSFHICEPTSSDPRLPGEDDHGCVRKNCDERGDGCGTRRVCDASRPNADDDGCSNILCDEPEGDCPNVNTKCDPDAETVDAYGCAPLRCELDEYSCPDYFVCDPEDERANLYGCVYVQPDVPVPTGVAGSTGSGPGPDGAAGSGPGPQGSAGRSTEPSGGGGASPSGPSPSKPSDRADEPSPPAPLPEVRPEGAKEGSGCEADIDCRKGYCVHGSCEASPGTCM
jgi:hypothetical protein